MDSLRYIIKSVGPKLIPFFKTVAIYFVILPSQENPSLLGTILKCLPVASLVLFVLLHGMSLDEQFKYSRRIVIGLAFCCVGDALLAWPGYFETGIIAFGIGHFSYILAFGFEPINVSMGIAILGLCVTSIIYLLPGIKGLPLTVGVPIYIFLIATMIWRALAQLSTIKDLRNWNKVCSSTGGLLFVISDLMLGINMFKFKINHAQTLVMSSYYTAQLAIALSVVDSSHFPIYN
ncbi:hypothetical protein WA026_009757 [Henosepilachna vigintioctopunctata]|uniref:lysoplasmalogenase n=1 Tax=Henosepilachna vigintioctopunctata TaxID=420089 RepID=A0AAW1TSR8_9CUCU